MIEANLFLEGDVAEVVQDKESMHMKLVCRNKYLVFSISDINHIQLGDRIEIKGTFKIEKVIVNGMETLYK